MLGFRVTIWSDAFALVKTICPTVTNKNLMFCDGTDLATNVVRNEKTHVTVGFLTS
jgi:hypothetical protein